MKTYPLRHDHLWLYLKTKFEALKRFLLEMEES